MTALVELVDDVSRVLDQMLKLKFRMEPRCLGPMPLLDFLDEPLPRGVVDSEMLIYPRDFVLRWGFATVGLCDLHALLESFKCESAV